MTIKPKKKIAKKKVYSRKNPTQDKREIARNRFAKYLREVKGEIDDRWRDLELELTPSLESDVKKLLTELHKLANRFAMYNG